MYNVRNLNSDFISGEFHPYITSEPLHVIDKRYII